MCNRKVSGSRKATVTQKAAAPHYLDTIANLLTRMEPGKTSTVAELFKDLKLCWQVRMQQKTDSGTEEGPTETALTQANSGIEWNYCGEPGHKKWKYPIYNIQKAQKA